MMMQVVHSMRRDYIAIALYGYMTAVLGVQAIRIVPIPLALQGQPLFIQVITTGSLVLGCLVCMVSRFWRDDLDGGAIEQTGLLISFIGWALYIYAFALLLPMSWFGTFLCGAFLIMFFAQWWSIHKWRRRLRLRVAELAKAKAAEDAPDGS